MHMVAIYVFSPGVKDLFNNIYDFLLSQPLSVTTNQSEYEVKSPIIAAISEYHSLLQIWIKIYFTSSHLVLRIRIAFLHGEYLYPPLN